MTEAAYVTGVRGNKKWMMSKSLISFAWPKRERSNETKNVRSCWPIRSLIYSPFFFTWECHSAGEIEEHRKHVRRLSITVQSCLWFDRAHPRDLPSPRLLRLHLNGRMWSNDVIGKLVRCLSLRLTNSIIVSLLTDIRYAWLLRLAISPFLSLSPSIYLWSG